MDVRTLALSSTSRMCPIEDEHTARHRALDSDFPCATRDLRPSPGVPPVSERPETVGSYRHCLPSNQAPPHFFWCRCGSNGALLTAATLELSCVEVLPPPTRRTVCAPTGE